jgi:hypothetical protein
MRTASALLSLYKMAFDLVTPSENQLLSSIPSERENYPPDILRSANAQRGEETLLCVNAYDWHNDFSEGHEEVKTHLSADKP